MVDSSVTSIEDLYRFNRNRLKVTFIALPAKTQTAQNHIWFWVWVCVADHLKSNRWLSFDWKTSIIGLPMLFHGKSLPLGPRPIWYLVWRSFFLLACLLLFVLVCWKFFSLLLLYVLNLSDGFCISCSLAWSSQQGCSCSPFQPEIAQQNWSQLILGSCFKNALSILPQQ